MQSGSDMARVVALVFTGAGAAFVAGGATGGVAAGGICAFGSDIFCNSAARVAAWSGLSSARTAVTTATAAKKIERMPNCFMLRFCGFCRDSSNLRRAGAPGGNRLVNSGSAWVRARSRRRGRRNLFDGRVLLQQIEVLLVQDLRVKLVH